MNAPAPGPARLHFDGWIAGIGTASGTRVVLGHWPCSPFGPFSDVMLEREDGHRLLLAPTRRTAEFIAGTYAFDEVRIVPVRVHVTGDRWTVTAGSLLDLRLTVGRRSLPGLALRAVPGALAARPGWTRVTDPPARVLLGVRTRGSAGGGRREWYGARDLHRITAASAVHEGRDLGPLAPVEPAVRFGFGSAPRTPSLVRVTTTVGAPRSAGRRGRPRRTPRQPGRRPVMNGPAQPGTPGPESTGGTDMKLLGVYLNDHLAGATAGAQRIGHLARTMRGSALGRALGPVAAEIDEDRATLLAIMRNLGVPVRHYKVWAGWAAEKAARLKGNGRLVRRSPLSTLLELEALRLGVEGKAAVWSTLRRLASTDERLDAALLDTLLDRAARQQDTVEEWRGRAAEAALRPTARAAA
ncbi:hypothetical protein GCM10009787_63360 [Streptomyces bangladeshensis]|uniref:Uncharacterized protein n=2 Tax=Streptomyces TaxID=1883 RepID=A0ABN3C0Y5_9ACTN